MSMKTISILTFLAVVSAVCVLPLSFAAGSSLVFLVGFACIAFADYARRSPSFYSAETNVESLSTPLRNLGPRLELAA
jgi:hypothetical protein